MPTSLLQRGCASLDKSTVIEPDSGDFGAECLLQGPDRMFPAPRGEIPADRDLRMGDVVNLNRFRKGKARSARQQLVAVNRHKFARPKAELLRLDAERAKHETGLDSHRVSDEPASEAGEKPATEPRQTD